MAALQTCRDCIGRHFWLVRLGLHRQTYNNWLTMRAADEVIKLMVCQSLPVFQFMYLLSCYGNFGICFLCFMSNKIN
jgi:hypothetical protein